MGFFSELGRFLSEIFSGPEEKVNEFSSAVVSVVKKEVPEVEQLAVFRRIAEQELAIRVRFDSLIHRFRPSGEEVSQNDSICTYIVTIGDTIQTLLGEEIHGYYLLKEEKIAEELRRSAQLQQASINFARVNKKNLRDTLWQAYGIKVTWKILNDPRYELTSTTNLEVWANDEWNRTHPVPSNY